MSPDWIKWEQILRPFRKKGVNFDEVVWHSDKKYLEAFLSIRAMLSERTVLSHMDYEAAANPAASGRPLELFIDASDYGWSATLNPEA